MKFLSSFAVAACIWGGAASCYSQSTFAFNRNPLVQEQDAAATSARFNQIAAKLKDPKVDGVAPLTEALRLCGFAIWTEGRQKIADPLDGANLNLAITDAEIRGYLALYRRGDRVPLANLADMFTPIYKELGGTKGMLEHFATIHLHGLYSPEVESRNVAYFLSVMARTHDDLTDSPLSPEAHLDPIQALIFTRIVSEELRLAMRKVASPSILMANTRPRPLQEAPGWAGDAFAGGVTGLIGEVLENAGGVAKTVGSFVGNANALMSISKFIMTYNFLKGTVTVEAPGQPLIRTKDKSAGEKRTVVAKFSIDGTGATDWLNAHRAAFNAVGFDPDVPKSAPLAGVEVEWDVKQDNKSTTRQLIRAVDGSGILNKQKTNDAGESRVTFEGMPQPKVIEPRTAMPVDKRVPIRISPQVKGVEMKQDLVDAVTGAIGLRGGPAGLVTPIMEMLYRAKWECPIPFVLEVRDWVDGELIGQFSAEINGSGSHRWTEGYASRHISRKLEFTDFGMKALGGVEVPDIDPALLKHLPPEQRKQVEQGLKEAKEASMQRTYISERPGGLRYTVNDTAFLDVDTSDCEESHDRWQSTTRVNIFEEGPSANMGDFEFTINADLNKMVAEVIVKGGGKGSFVRMALSKDTKPANTTSTVQPFSGINIKAPHSSGRFILPLKETPLRDQQGSNYHGAITVPFTFGPEDKYTGSIIMAYSITRKNVPKPK